MAKSLITPSAEKYAPKTSFEITMISTSRYGQVLNRESFGLNYISPNKASYFSWNLYGTGESWFRSEFGDELYDQLMQVFKPLHLADDDGVPMYAVENGFYYVQIARGEAKYHTPADGDKEKYTIALAKHLRIDHDTAVHIVETFDKQMFIDYCESCKPRWQAEADHAIATLEELKRTLDAKASEA